MIDTFRISVNDFEVKSLDFIDIDLGISKPVKTYELKSIKHSTKQKEYETIIKRVETGQNILFYLDKHPIRGFKAYINTEFLNCTFRNSAGSPKLIIQFSIPKIYSKGKSNVLGVEDKTAFFTCLLEVEHKLKEMGIFFNIESGLVKRLDLFKNIFLEYDFLSYADVLSSIYFRYEKNSKTYNNETFLKGNKTQQICLYNKYKEQKIKGLELPLGYENCLRAEYRFLNNRVLKKESLGAVNDIKKGFDDLKLLYNEKIKMVFRHNIEIITPQKPTITKEAFFEYAVAMQKQGVKQGFYIDSIFFNNTGLDIDLILSWQKELEALQGRKNNRAFYNKKKKEYELKKLTQSFFTDLMKTEQDNFTNKYIEIKTKLLA